MGFQIVHKLLKLDQQNKSYVSQTFIVYCATHLLFSNACDQDYPKLSKSYYDLLEVLTQDHMEFVSTLEPDVFIYILSTISEGLTGLSECTHTHTH